VRPRADEIMASVVATFEEYIVPEVDEPFAQSIALTLSNLMRLVRLRIQQEGPMLHADNVDLRATLAEVGSYMRGADGRFAELVVEIDDVLAAPNMPVDEYPTLAWMDDQATTLRWILQRALEALDAARADIGTNDDYATIRQRIRQYLRRSVEREGAVILPAFTGERR